MRFGSVATQQFLDCINEVVRIVVRSLQDIPRYLLKLASSGSWRYWFHDTCWSELFQQGILMLSCRSYQPLDLLEKSQACECNCNLSNLITYRTSWLCIFASTMLLWTKENLSGRWRWASTQFTWVDNRHRLWFFGGSGAENECRRCCFAGIWLGGEFV